MLEGITACILFLLETELQTFQHCTHNIVHLPTDCSSSSHNVPWILHTSGHRARRKQFIFQREVSLVSSVFSVSSLHAWGLVVLGPWCLYPSSDKLHTMLKHSLLPIAPYFSDTVFFPQSFLLYCFNSAFYSWTVVLKFYFIMHNILFI